MSLVIILILAGVAAWTISARALSPAAALFWGGNIAVTIPCYYIPSGSPSPCPAGWVCPCSFGPSNCMCSCREHTPVAPINYKVFMGPELGGKLGEPAYCHPSYKEVITAKANIFGPAITTIVIPTGDFPAVFAPTRSIMGFGASFLEPLFVATAP